MGFHAATLVWCLLNRYTFVALKLAWGEARGRECIRRDTRPTEQRSPRPISVPFTIYDLRLARRRLPGAAARIFARAFAANDSLHVSSHGDLPPPNHRNRPGAGLHG